MSRNETAALELEGQFPNEVIRASAGTGKTFELSNRYLRLLASGVESNSCLLYTSPSPRDRQKSRMPSSA